MNEHENESHAQEEGKEGRRWGPEGWAECCPGFGRAHSGCCDDTGMRRAMASCFRGCRYFLLIPIVLAVVFLVLGYYLDAETIRVLWIVNAAMVAGMGLIGVLLMWRLTGGRRFLQWCGTGPRGKS